jgi:hypothetical protein
MAIGIRFCSAKAVPRLLFVDESASALDQCNVNISGLRGESMWLD